MISVNRQKQELVIARTNSNIQLAAEYFDRDFSPVSVLFDLTGRAAGMYRVRDNIRVIRYNPVIFARYFDDNLAQTVPHEVAHYISDILYGLRNIRPHGPEWKQIMEFFGADTRATCSYNLDGLPLRRYRQFRYLCRCRQHLLTSRRHNKIERNEMHYFCKYCGDRLTFHEQIL